MIKKYLFMLLLIFPNLVFAANSCTVFFESSLLANAISNYQRIIPTNAQFGNYKPAEYSITMFQTGENQNCAVLVRGLDVQKFTLESSFGDLPEFASIIRGHTSNEETPVEYQNILQRLGINYNLLVNVNYFAKIEDLHAQGKAIDFVEASYNWISLIVHEGFHIFVQDSYEDLDPNHPLPWPSWDHQPPRDRVSSECYKDARIASLLQSEFTSLQKAVHAILVENNRDKSIQLAQEYIGWLKKRRELQSDDRVPISYSPDEKEKMSCAQAEAIMEIEEGIPDFLGMKTAIVSKTGTKEMASDYIEAWNPGDKRLYYITGAAKLFIMSELDSPRYYKAMDTLLNSTRWEEGLNFQFEKFIDEVSQTLK